MGTRVDIGKVLITLYENYKMSVENETVRKPISYALYHTWKFVDGIEKARSDEHTEFKPISKIVHCDVCDNAIFADMKYCDRCGKEQNND